MPTPRPIVAELAAITRQRRIRVSDLASALGVKPCAVSRWNVGHAHPRYALAVKWANHLGFRLAATDRAGRVLMVDNAIPDRIRALKAAPTRGHGLAAVDDHLKDRGLHLTLTPKPERRAA